MDKLIRPRRISRGQSWSQSSLARKHTVRNIWKFRLCAGLWRLSGILPSRTMLVVSSISGMTVRSDLWVREYGWRDPRPRTGCRILGILLYFLVKDILHIIMSKYQAAFPLHKSNPRLIVVYFQV